MKLVTAITFAAIALAGFLLPGVYCAMDYDTLRLRQLLDELMERELFPADESSANDVASRRSDQDLALRDSSDILPREVPMPLFVSVHCGPGTTIVNPFLQMAMRCRVPPSTTFDHLHLMCPTIVPLAANCHGQGELLFLVTIPSRSTPVLCQGPETLEACNVQRKSRIHVVKSGLSADKLPVEMCRRLSTIHVHALFVPIDPPRLPLTICRVLSGDKIVELPTLCPDFEMILPHAPGQDAVRTVSVHHRHPDSLPQQVDSHSTMADCNILQGSTIVITDSRSSTPPPPYSE